MSHVHISNADIERYIAEGLDRVEAGRIHVHCTQCEQCAGTLSGIRALQVKVVYVGCALSECFSGTTMEKYADPGSDLSNDEREMIRVHLAGCFLCQTELELVGVEIEPLM